MKVCEFLLQKEGDRVWLPLEPPTVEILEGRYRIVARTQQPQTEVLVEVSYWSPDEMPPKRRTQHWNRYTNAKGIMPVLPFTALRSGNWRIQCSSNLLMDMGENGWEHVVELRVLAQEEDLESWPRNSQEFSGATPRERKIQPDAAPLAAVPVQSPQQSPQQPPQPTVSAEEEIPSDMEPDLNTNPTPDLNPPSLGDLEVAPRPRQATVEELRSLAEQMSRLVLDTVLEAGEMEPTPNATADEDEETRDFFNVPTPEPIVSFTPEVTPDAPPDATIPEPIGLEEINPASTPEPSILPPIVQTPTTISSPLPIGATLPTGIQLRLQTNTIVPSVYSLFELHCYILTANGTPLQESALPLQARVMLQNPSNMEVRLAMTQLLATQPLSQPFYLSGHIALDWRNQLLLGEVQLQSLSLSVEDLTEAVITIATVPFTIMPPVDALLTHVSPPEPSHPEVHPTPAPPQSPPPKPRIKADFLEVTRRSLSSFINPKTDDLAHPSPKVAMPPSPKVSMPPSLKRSSSDSGAELPRPSLNLPTFVQSATPVANPPTDTDSSFDLEHPESVDSSEPGTGKDSLLEGLKTDHLEETDGLVTDGLETGNLETEGLVTGNLETDDLETEGLETDNLVIDGLETDDLVTGNLVTDGLETDDLVTGNLVTDDLIIGGLVTYHLETDNLVTEGLDIAPSSSEASGPNAPEPEQLTLLNLAEWTDPSVIPSDIPPVAHPRKVIELPPVPPRSDDSAFVRDANFLAPLSPDLSAAELAALAGAVAAAWSDPQMPESPSEVEPETAPEAPTSSTLEEIDLDSLQEEVSSDQDGDLEAENEILLALALEPDSDLDPNPESDRFPSVLTNVLHGDPSLLDQPTPPDLAEPELATPPERSTQADPLLLWDDEPIPQRDGDLSADAGNFFSQAEFTSVSAQRSDPVLDSFFTEPTLSATPTPIPGSLPEPLSFDANAESLEQVQVPPHLRLSDLEPGDWSIGEMGESEATVLPRRQRDPLLPDPLLPDPFVPDPFVPEHLRQEIVVDDEWLEPDTRHWMSLAPPQTIVTWPEDDPLPVPILEIPHGDLVGGESVRVTLRLPETASRLVVKLWLLDCQTRSLAAGPFWAYQFLPTLPQFREAIVEIPIPLGCLEVQVEALTMESETQRESHKMSVVKTIVPPETSELNEPPENLLEMDDLLEYLPPTLDSLEPDLLDLPGENR